MKKPSPSNTHHAGDRPASKTSRTRRTGGSVLVKPSAVGVCGTRRGDRRGASTAGHPRARRAWSRARVPRPGDRPGPHGAFSAGRSRRRIVRRPDPVPCRTAPWASGTCAATASTRARHQADRRVHVRALADRARIRRQGDPSLGLLGAARADHRRHEGVGQVAGSGTVRSGTAVPCSSPAPGRSACCGAESQAATASEVHVARPHGIGSKPDLVRHWEQPITSARAGVGFEAGRVIGVPASAGHRKTRQDRHARRGRGADRRRERRADSGPQHGRRGPPTSCCRNNVVVAA